METNIIITPEGGHATVWMSRRAASAGYPLHLRPDTAFGWELDFDEKPLPNHEKQWKGRTGGCPLDYGISINENLLRFIESAQHKIMLCGRVSGNGKGMFLTRFGIKALCVVRHPAVSMSVFLNQQHPEHARRFTGGPFDTVACAEWYGARWKKIVRDFLDSGNIIARHETFLEDVNAAGYTEIARVFRGWDSSIRAQVPLSPAVADALKEIVKPEFGELYGTHWTKWKKYL
jgi:hypothetical protein